MFCGNCGSKLKTGAIFCGECGNKCEANRYDNLTRQTEVYPQYRNNLSNQISPSHQHHNNPKVVSFDLSLSRKTKAFIFLIVLLAISYFAGSKVVESLSDPLKVVEKFYTALETKDVETVRELLFTSHPNLNITEESVNSYLDYLHNEEKNKIAIYKKEWLSQAKTYSSNKESKKTISDSTELNMDFTLKNTGKKFFLIDEYKFEVLPCFVEVSSNEAGSVVFVNENEVGITKIDTTLIGGPYFPGYYNIKLNLDSEYTVVSNEEEVLLSASTLNSGSKKEVYLPLDTMYVTVDCIFDDALIYVNGTNTELKVGSGELLGPVDETTLIRVHKETPFGELISDEVKISEASSPYFTFENSLLLKEIAMEVISQFTKELSDGFNGKSTEWMTIVTDNVKEIYQPTFEGMHDVSESYSMDIQKVNIGDVKLTNYQNNKYVMNVETTLFIEICELFGDWNVSEYERTGNLTISYDTNQKKWLITDVQLSPYGVIQGEVIEFNPLELLK